MEKYLIIIGVLSILIFYMGKKSRKRQYILYRKKLNLLGYDILYSDELGGKTLKSETYNITGKPDYILSKNDMIIPAEIKSGNHTEPYKNDLMQLAMYFLLAEDLYGENVPYGYLAYKNCYFKVYNTAEIKNEITDILKSMRTMLSTGEDEVTPSFVKCKHCAVRETVCTKGYKNDKEK